MNIYKGKVVSEQSEGNTKLSVSACFCMWTLVCFSFFSSSHSHQDIHIFLEVWGRNKEVEHECLKRCHVYVDLRKNWDARSQCAGILFRSFSIFTAYSKTNDFKTKAKPKQNQSISLRKADPTIIDAALH